jgi:hypothetical protein
MGLDTLERKDGEDNGLLQQIWDFFVMSLYSDILISFSMLYSRV